MPSGALDLNGGGRAVKWNNVGDSMTYANIHDANINPGQTADSWAAITTFTAGSIHELVYLTPDPTFSCNTDPDYITTP